MFFATRDTKKNISFFPPLSILKPLKGADFQIEKNLESFFHLDYPAPYEIIFCLESHTDPVSPLVHDLVQQYPHILTKIVIGPTLVGVNPKINNLMKGYQQAQFDHLLISDSNIIVSSDYLKKMVSFLDDQVGIVTNAVQAIPYDHQMCSYMESLFFNTYNVRAMFLANSLSHPCVWGKSMLFVKSVFEKFGGLSFLSPYLVEDYVAGQAVKKLGFRVVLSTEMVIHPLGSVNFSSLLYRQSRWGRSRKYQQPFIFFLEPILFVPVTAFLGASFFHMWNIPFFSFYIGYVCVCFGLDQIILKNLGIPLKKSQIVYWILREFILLPLWIYTVLGNTVWWRGKKFKIFPGGQLQEITR